MMRHRLQEQGVTADQIVFRSPQMEGLVNLAGRVAVSRATFSSAGRAGRARSSLPD